MNYLDEFLLIASVHLLAVASPGPDFAVIMKNSICYGRKTALYTSLGIGTGILLHVTYSLIGIGLLIASEPQLLTGLKVLAAAYFCYLAYGGLTAKSSHQEISYQQQLDGISNKKAFVTGFLVNGINIKATLFFVSLFAMAISSQTPFMIKLGYGIYMAVATVIWFSSLSYLLSHDKIRSRLQRKGYWLERIMGVVLLLLAIEIMLSVFSS